VLILREVLQARAGMSWFRRRHDEYKQNVSR
jgi:hypothetical protein